MSDDTPEPVKAEDLVRLSFRVAGIGARLSLSSLRWTERLLLAALGADPEATPPGPPADAPAPAFAETVAASDAPGVTMESLLARSLVQSAETGYSELYAKLLLELVPDEARILSALSDGSRAALVHVERRGVLSSQRRLENASSIGRGAALTLPGLTATYVTHLLGLGLVEVGAETPELKADYEALLAERTVREAIKEAEIGPVPPRILRHTLRLSPLGHELWEACRSDEATGP